MRKIKYVLFLIICLMVSTHVSAANTKNGVPITPNSNTNDVSVEVTCKYKMGYEFGFSRDDKDDIETECHEGLENGCLPSYGDSYLKSQGFLDDNGNFDCPMYVYVDEDYKATGFGNTSENINYYVELISKESSCIGACQGEQYDRTNPNDYWTCEYTGPGGKLTTKYDGLYLIYFPDGSFSEVEHYDIGDGFCSDIYYNPHIGEDEFKLIGYNISILRDKEELEKIYDLVCRNENLVGEYYCAGNCKFPDNKNISCKDLKEKLEGGGGTKEPPKIDLTEMCNNNGVRNGLKLVGSLLLIVKIVIPILLIVMGSIDFGKAVVSSEGDEVQKAMKKLVNRIIAGIAIFLLPTAVKFVFKLIPISNDFEECSTCVFHPNKCDTK